MMLQCTNFQGQREEQPFDNGEASAARVGIKAFRKGWPGCSLLKCLVYFVMKH